MDRREIEKRAEPLEPLTDYLNYYGNRIPGDKLAKARAAHGLDAGEYVFFLHDKTLFGGAKNSLLATERGVSYRDTLLGSGSMYIPWSSVIAVSVDRPGPRLSLLADGKSYTLAMNPCNLPLELDELLLDLAAKEQSRHSVSLRRVEEILKETRAAIPGSRRMDLLAEAIQACDQMMSESQTSPVERAYSVSTTIQWNTHIKNRSEALWLSGNWQSASEDLLGAAAKMNPEAEAEDLAEFYGLLSSIAEEQGRNQDMMIYIARASALPIPRECRSELRQSLGELQTEHAKFLAEQPPVNRQIVYCTTEIPREPVADLAFASVRQLQGTNWKFQVGHPIEQSLYVCHPLRPDRYFVMEDFHLKMFEDKYTELVRLIEALGASQVRVEAIAGLRRDLSSAGSADFEAGAENLVAAAVVAGSTDQSTEAMRQATQKGLWSFELRPSGPPYVPPDLVWFPHEPSWERMADSCLKGRCRQFAIELRYQEDFSINTRRIERLAASLGAFGSGMEVTKCTVTEEQIRELKSTVWRVTASFPQTAEVERATAPPPSPPVVRQAIQEYLSDLADVYEGGEPSEAVRRLLKRRQRNLGLSDREAEEAEELFRQRLALSSAEREYLEDLEDALTDGVLSDDEARMLDRTRSRLHISNERAAEIKRMADKRPGGN